jgi:hypothetical protein
MEIMPADTELFRRIDEVVHYIWDPIGISESPQARDEYQAYLKAIVGRVKAGELDAIVEYMKWVAGDRMGLSFDEKKARRAAEVMLEWHRVIDSRS